MRAPTYIVMDIVEDYPAGVVFADGTKDECLRNWVIEEFDLDEEDNVKINQESDKYELIGPFNLVQ